MSGEIFISYRRSDQAKAELLHRLLKERGVESWYDALLGAGEDWRTVTAGALEKAPIFVLLFFLRRVRLTVLIAASIPLSIFLALPVMYFMGQSINLISLLGLMICVGLVVDNSVVVAENIEHYRGRGMGPYAAALHGASEVALPITLATLTTMIVFAPAALLSSGVTQFFMIRMVTPVCVSLLASLFVALALVPIASAVAFRDATPLLRSRRWLAPVLLVDQTWKRWTTAVYEATMGRINRLYGRLLRVSLRRRMDVVVPSLLTFWNSTLGARICAVASSLSRNFLPTSVIAENSVTPWW